MNHPTNTPRSAADAVAATTTIKALDKRAETLNEDEKRELAELVNRPKLRALIQRKLHEAGRDPAEMDTWTERAALGIRLSKEDYDGRTPRGPETQMNRHAEMCILNEWRPAELLLELKSAYGKKDPRRKFHEMFDRIEHGELEVEHVVFYHADRFARDEVVAVAKMEMLRDFKRNGKPASIGLHESCDPTRVRSLNNKLEWDGWMKSVIEARAQSDATKRRIDEHYVGKAERGELISPIDRVYGYTPEYNTRVIRVGRYTIKEEYQIAAKLNPEESEHLLDAIGQLRAGSASCPAIARAKKEAGVDWRGLAWDARKLWDAVTHPRVAGLQVCGKTDNGEDILVPAPIPAIVSEEVRQELVELREASRMNPNVTAWSRNLMSEGLAVCGVCGANMVRSGAYYRCNGQSGGDVLHPTPRAEVIEKFTQQATLLAYQDEQTADRAKHMTSDRASLDGERARLQAELDRLEEEGNIISRNERKGRLTEAEADRQYKEVAEERAPVQAKLDALATKVVSRQRFAASPEDARRKMETGTVSEQRRLIRSVIERVVVSGAPEGKLKDRDIERRFEVVWCDDTPVPVEAVEKLATWMLSERKQATRAAGKMATCSPEADETMFKLWKQGKSNSQIAAELTRRDIPTAQGLSEWSSALVAYPLKRVCKERGETYKANKGPTVIYAPGVLKTVYSLVIEKGKTEGDAATLLNAMKRESPSGKPWTGRMVRWAVDHARADRGEEVEHSGGRPKALPDEVLGMLDTMREEGSKWDELARWLNEDMELSTATGKDWCKSTVQRQVARYRQALAVAA